MFLGLILRFLCPRLDLCVFALVACTSRMSGCIESWFLRSCDFQAAVSALSFVKAMDNNGRVCVHRSGKGEGFKSCV